MTRFQASGPRVRYTPVESEKPFKQIVGLYNMWQSLSPETREWIGNLFRRKGMVKADTGFDPNLATDIVRVGTEDWSSDLGAGKPTYEYDRETDEVKRTGGKTVSEILDEENLQKPKYDWSKINPFDKSEGSTRMMVFGSDPSRRNTPMTAKFTGGYVTAREIPDIPSAEELMFTGSQLPTFRTEDGDTRQKMGQRRIVGMNEYLDKALGEGGWRYR